MNVLSSRVMACCCSTTLLAAIILITGCATQTNWNSRIGSLTFDEAVVELGPPDKQAKLQDGTLVAEWLTHRGSTYVYPAYGYGNAPYWYATPPAPMYLDAPDYFLRLTFNPEGKLQAWKKIVK
jgi:hypothetical protein